MKEPEKKKRKSRKKKTPSVSNEIMLELLKSIISSSGGENKSLPLKNLLFKKPRNLDSNMDVLIALSNVFIHIDQAIKIRGLGKVLEEIREVCSAVPEGFITRVSKEKVISSWEGLIGHLKTVNSQLRDPEEEKQW